jgi:hypothetical protein
LTSAIASSSNYTILSALAQAAQTRAQQSQTQQLALIDNQIQKQLQTKIAALQQAPDSSSTNVLQSQVNQVSSTKSNLTTLQSQYSNNQTILVDLQNQLANLQTAASAGNSTGYDGYLALANADLSNLTDVQQNPIFQVDGVQAFQTSGLGISSSTSYGLSTSSGQAAAEAAINNAQIEVNQIATTTTGNVLVAGSEITALSSQYENLNNELEAQQSAQTDATQAEVTTLTTQATTQEHLIELALGNSQAQAASLLAQENPPTATKGVFGVLQNSVGQTASSYLQQAKTTASAPSILSLFS